MSNNDAIPTLPKFYDMLERHDWYHMMSDSDFVWRAGEAAEKELIQIAERGGAAYKKLFDSYATCVWRRLSVRPERPKE